ncbi:MAG: hypothetical protein ACRDRN_20160 [Sciscionella sp.]
MVQLNFRRGDEQIKAILRDPDKYFAEASARAWARAKDDVDSELANRAERRNHDNGTARRSSAHATATPARPAGRIAESTTNAGN